MIINLNEHGITVTIVYICEKPPYTQRIKLIIASKNTNVTCMSFYKRYITDYRYSTYDIYNNKFINILIEANIIESCGAEICLSNEILLQLI
jgi:hypothetical protein